jgi:hypothetical protein
MSLKSIVVQLTTDDQEIRGSFRALVSSAGIDILILGSKKSSMLFKLAKITIESITIRHVGDPYDFNVTPKNRITSYSMVAGEQILIETFKPESKKQAYFILTALYIKYKNEKSIVKTESSCVTEQCTIVDLKHPKKASKCKIYEHPSCVRPNHVLTKKVNETPFCKRDMEPNLHGNSDMTVFLNEISEGREYERRQNHWKQGYSGQLINSS